MNPIDEYIIDLDIDIIDARNEMKKSRFIFDEMNGIFFDHFHMNISRQKEKEKCNVSYLFFFQRMSITS